jgi:uncharacterized protein (DUF362 family)
MKIAATSTGGVLLEQLLTACGLKPTPSSPTATTRATNTAFPPTITTGPGTPTPTPMDTPVEPSAIPAPPDLVVVRGGEPEPMVRQALAAFGGMGTFVPAGARVVIKPNICVSYRSYEYAATTNPWVVAALVRLCLEAGASSVKVMDYPFSGSGEDAYATSGIQEQVEAAGGQMEVMTSLKYVPMPIPNGVKMKAAKVYKEALDADVLIDVPIAKDHGNTRLTLGMKNLMGLVPDGDRGSMHSQGIHQCVADLATLIRPRLTVVDAVRILTDGGPQGGNLDAVKKLDTIIVSPDIVAADSFATTLFGLTPEDIGYITKATALGVGRSDLQNLNIQELTANA